MTKPEGNHIMLLQNWHLTLSVKINWNTKEDKDKSKAHVLNVLQLGKGTSQDKETSNSEKTKPIAFRLVYCQVMLG